jgi:hypothetical protein
LEKSGCKKMKRDSTIRRVFALERDEIINLVFASLGVVSSSHFKLDRLLANIFKKTKQHKLYYRCEFIFLVIHDEGKYFAR